MRAFAGLVVIALVVALVGCGPKPSADTEFWWTWWARVAATIATLLAVVVAMLGEKLRLLLFRPRLHLRIRQAEGNLGEDRGPGASGAEVVQSCRWYHLRVENQRRRLSPAHGVHVVLTRIEEVGRMEPLWVEEFPMSWSHRTGPHTVGPHVDVNLCSVLQQGKEFALEVAPRAPYGLQRKFGLNRRIRVTFVGRSDETDSDPIRIEMSWDGEWHDDAKEMANHFCVRLVA
jgi:hypothetical protein